ncbi:CbrC family protein [Streptomyces chrestomyceticus]|uniref:CbrC family protein n=1 Tax=Streptomyces chrestomyceticus TaxID=68185 RepID=UPI0033DB1A58
MTEQLPDFPYHPDPLATGSVIASDAVCIRCNRDRGYLYTGPVYTEADVDDGVCPWCIADGSAARQYDAQFTGGPSDDIPDATWETLSTRTPGYSTWQGDGDWLVHCGDGAAFLGPVGARELAGYPDAVEALRQETAGWGGSADDVERYLAALDKDGWATAYLFRCRSCSVHLAYSDFA